MDSPVFNLRLSKADHLTFSANNTQSDQPSRFSYPISVLTLSVCALRVPQQTDRVQRRVYPMKSNLLIIAMIALVMAGCRYHNGSARNNDGGLAFKDTLIEFAEATKNQPGRSQAGRDLYPSDPSVGSGLPAQSALVRETLADGSVVESEVFDQFEFGPLDDFSFDDAENFRHVRLEDAIKMALTNAPVVRDLGGLILRAPDAAATSTDPALAYLDPRFGEEAALSAFDATYNSQLLFQKNDNFFNNQFIGDEGVFQQDLAQYSAGISKLSATGATYGINNVIDYELNNSPSNRFNDNSPTSFAYDLSVEAEFRQPLFQGAGTTFNRIAGPNNAVGVYNGVSIARTNTDVALADFETRIRDLISNVENTYWDLYFAYRDLEAKIDARDGAYKIWQNLEANRAEKSAAVIGQAKEQYYRFAVEVEEAIHGRLNEGTRTNNGSSSGTFRRTGGVRVAERRLRLITGMPVNDSKLVVPADVPNEAISVFNWQSIRENALTRRTELRRQRWRLKRRELELLASKNLLLPRVDLLGTYRIKGFGRDLFGSGNELQPDASIETQLDSSALGTFFNGNLQEWELGVDATIPIGFRHQHAAVRHAELNLAREKSVLSEQQRQIVFGLSNAVGELRRAERVRAANQNRLDAANEQFAAIENLYQEQDTTIDLVLEAQRRVIESKLQYFQSQVEYMLAVKSVHFEQGTLFQYHNIQFGEADAAFAEFNSLMASDLMTAAPHAQQQPFFQPPTPQETSQGTSESVTGSSQRPWQPVIGSQDTESSRLTPPEPDSSTSDAVKKRIAEPKVEPELRPPSRRNMFDEQ